VGDPTGPFRRRIRIAARPGVVTADLEDDFHHFGVELHHDGELVVSMDASAPRYPWSTCPSAGTVLRELHGAPLSPRVTAAAEHSDPRAHCTHLFDLAALAMAHAARDTAGRCQYDAEIPTVDDAGRASVRLWRDRIPVHTWTLAFARDGRRRVVDPEPFTVAPWHGGFMRWAEASFEPEAAEAAIVLRRACEIGLGRGMDLEAYATAGGLRPIMEGVCFSMQPERIERAVRMRGTIRDFAAAPDALLDDEDAATA